MLAGLDLLQREHGDHVDARSADAHRKEPAPVIRVQIRHLIVHNIATRLPERFSRNDLSWLVPLKLEQDPAFEHVPENRSGMAMRRQPGVCGRKFDELCHRMCALGNRGRGDAQQIGDLDVSCNQHVFDANPDLALAVGPLLHREQGPVQSEPTPHTSNRANASSAANHALGSTQPFAMRCSPPLRLAGILERIAARKLSDQRRTTLVEDSSMVRYGRRGYTCF